MAFGYVISLDLDGALAVVVGGGPVAATRVADLRDAGAHVRVIAPTPSEELVAAVEAAGAQLHRRPYAAGDLEGARIAIATREADLDDALDVEAFWAESRERGVLASVLDDLDHADFAAPALVRSGSLRIAVATAGRAPALAKRLRAHLETEFGDTAGDLVDALADARELAGPRDVSFAEWSARWDLALHDLGHLFDLMRSGRRDEVVARTVAIVTGRDDAGTASRAAPGAEVPS